VLSLKPSILQAWQWFASVAVTSLILTSSSSRAQEKAPTESKPLRVLFIGNSQVYYNDLPLMVELLANSAPMDRPRIVVDRALAGGASLESHWNRGTAKGTARARIAEGMWDYVVLQDIYNIKEESFTKYAKLFDDLVREHGGKTILFSTASISTQYPKGFQTLHDMQAKLATERKLPIAAAGRAWMTYWGAEPTSEERLVLYAPDKAHPGKMGSYIYACTLYAVITGHSPVGLTTRVQKATEDVVSPADAKRMQEVAWAVHNELNTTPPAAKP
jgi:hypothetical protein